MAKSRSVREARRTLERLRQAHPDAHCALEHRTTLELLIATVLSAQTTDVAVNQITPRLFARWPDARALAGARQTEVEKTINRIGMFRQKSKNVIGLAKALVDKHAGEVPGRLADLVELPGVGRKTANVVLNCAFGQETFAVDTHIFRVGNRTGLAPGANPAEVEAGLMRVVPKEYLPHAHHWLILHGRYTCKARLPECWRCPVVDLCAFRRKVLAPPRSRRP